MGRTHDTRPVLLRLTAALLLAACLLVTGCNEVEPIKKELLKKLGTYIGKKKSPFIPRDGITIRTCSLYRSANLNSEVIRDLPAEATVHLMDKVGEWYRVRTRDGKEGYIEQKIIGGEEIIQQIQGLKKSIEGIPPQAEGVTKARANFRLQPGREYTVVEVLPQGKKFEVYARVVTVRHSVRGATGQQDGPDKPFSYASSEETTLDDFKKDAWYKVKIEDGRVGYLYSHNMTLTPPEDIARLVPFMRMVAWRTINVTDDPDRGPINNYLVAYAPIGKDPGCDYTKLYLMAWSSRLKRRIISWQMKLSGILPITAFHFEGKPGFSVRYLHPSKKDKLVRADFGLSRGSIKKVSEEEVPNPSPIH